MSHQESISEPALAAGLFRIAHGVDAVKMDNRTIVELFYLSAAYLGSRAEVYGYVNALFDPTNSVGAEALDKAHELLGDLEEKDTWFVSVGLGEAEMLSVGIADMLRRQMPMRRDTDRIISFLDEVAESVMANEPVSGN
jgi:hypothetical protein